jgi:DNA-binding NtrC family response regulator
MPRAIANLESLSQLLDRSHRPVYAVDPERRIIYCNPALAAWLDLETEQIRGRHVEYHSEPTEESTSPDEAAPLADLCPPPKALAGEACTGTVSCVSRSGRLVHRHAEFVPLGTPGGRNAVGTDGRSSTAPVGVLVLLADCDMSHQQLASELSAEPTADDLHRTIRRFRRAQSARYALESLLGDSSAMRKVRAQVDAAAASAANVAIIGRSGSGRGHVARAIHYRAAGDAESKLIPIDCQSATDDRLRRAFDSLRLSPIESRQRPTLLLENLDLMPPAQQTQLAAAVRQSSFPARVVATIRPADAEDPGVDRILFDTISTITIVLPRLADRAEDLPILAQYFLELANLGSPKQIGSLRADALDLLSLYSWPGELEQLQQAISAAHRGCKSHEITPADLPAIIHHAAQTASRRPRQPERIILAELLATIEREAISRALRQTGGNKSEAAGILGMTRPRLYRRLVQLGLVTGDDTQPADDKPEFVERPPDEEPK